MKLTLKHTLYPALVAGAVTMSGGAMAQTATADLTVTLNIAGSCTVAAQTVAFDEQTSLTLTQESIPTTITVNCSQGLPYELGLGMGQANQGTQRRMAAGGHFVNYGIYTDNTYTTSLTAVGGTNSITSNGTGADQTHAIYARLPAQAATGYGSYSDKPVMTIQW